ncbi:MAG: hypothetical protein M3Z37_11860, partial [Candidatus Eremiobacteraeota bacterium]|nr:hypothetical protein [Candidatus Eremiobacteraeota bacterium]
TRVCGDPPVSGISLEAGVPSDGRVALSFGASHAFAQWRLPGEHNLRDALLACAAAIATGVAFADVAAGCGELRLPPGRFETHLLPNGARVVYDAYNASPTSMQYALLAFAALPAARHIAVLGSMAELGPASHAQHEATGAAAARSGVDMLFCGGESADALCTGARNAGLRADALHTYENNAEITQRLRSLLAADDCVLLKGSRVQRMEEILSGLLAAGSLAS